MTSGIEARLIALALGEDGLATGNGGLAEEVFRHESAGDATSTAIVDPHATAEAELVARQPGVLAGVGLTRSVFAAVDEGVAVTARLGDGDSLAGGRVIAHVVGPARSVLAAERTALNILTHLCGVASLTRHYVQALQGTGCVVRDTRKTFPGLRAAEKAAVAAGGGVNHRASLADGLLVKDNHVVAAGGVGNATRLALDAADGLDVQVEVDDLPALDEALDAGAPAVLCDNFGLDDLAAAVSRCRQSPWPVFVEASGGIALDNAAAVAATGVDAIAVGALTHSAQAVDVGLDLHHARSGVAGNASEGAG